MNNRVIHFEIGCNEPERIITFYKKAFGWTITQMDNPEPYWTVNTGEIDTPGIDGGIYKNNDKMKGTINTINTNNLEQITNKIVNAGGKNLSGILHIPNVGKLTYFADPEGTVFGVIQMTENTNI